MRLRSMRLRRYGPDFISERTRAVLALIDMDRLQPIDFSLGGVGKIVIGIVHIDVLVSPPLAGNSTANSVVAFGGHG